MKHVKPLTLNEDLFNIRDLDYVDAFSELFEVFAHLKLKKYIDRDGNLIKSIDDINDELDYLKGLDEWFNDEEDYLQQLGLIRDVLKNYRNKI